VLAILPLALLLCFGAGLRIHALLNWKTGLSHDESVTYLCSSATQGRYYEELHLFSDTLISTSTIQRLHDPPERHQFGRVAEDMARWDIHPPMYFWTLHAWAYMGGAGPPAGGAWLNVIISLFILILVYRLAWSLLGDPRLALLVCVLWYLSPAVVQIDLEARHYGLFTFFALASFLLSQRLLFHSGGPWTWALFILVNTAGMLTHYYFAFLLLPGMLVVILQDRFRIRTWRYTGSLLLSTVLFLLCFPQIFTFLDIFLSGGPEDGAPTRTIMEKLRTFVFAFMGWFTDLRILRYLFLPLLPMVLWLAWKRIIAGDGPMRLQALNLSWAILFNLLFYVIEITPSQAVGEQYFGYIWPLLAVFLVFGFRRLAHTWTGVGIIGLFLLQLVPSFHISVRDSPYLKNLLPEEWRTQIGTSDLLITDLLKRSELPALVQQLPADLPLYVVRQGTPEIPLDGRVVILRKKGRTSHLDKWATTNASTARVHGKLILQEWVTTGPESRPSKQ
jgi:hypothetical protein